MKIHIIQVRKSEDGKQVRNPIRTIPHSSEVLIRTWEKEVQILDKETHQILDTFEYIREDPPFTYISEYTGIKIGRAHV